MVPITLFNLVPLGDIMINDAILLIILVMFGALLITLLRGYESIFNLTYLVPVAVIAILGLCYGAQIDRLTDERYVDNFRVFSAWMSGAMGMLLGVAIDLCIRGHRQMLARATFKKQAPVVFQLKRWGQPRRNYKPAIDLMPRLHDLA